VRRPRVLALFLSATMLVLSSCGERAGSPLAERGRQVYLGQCTSCHATDPAQPGPVGPPLKGTSREVLEAKTLRGGYPPGYQPRRKTAIMPPQSQVAGELDALAEYLK
jgi:mono/diheme cytochrome c family protein